MPRKPKPEAEKIVLYVRLPTGTYERLRLRAYQDRRSMADLACEALDAFLVGSPEADVENVSGKVRTAAVRARNARGRGART